MRVVLQGLRDAAQRGVAVAARDERLRFDQGVTLLAFDGQRRKLADQALVRRIELERLLETRLGLVELAGRAKRPRSRHRLCDGLATGLEQARAQAHAVGILREAAFEFDDGLIRTAAGEIGLRLVADPLFGAAAQEQQQHRREYGRKTVKRNGWMSHQIGKRLALLTCTIPRWSYR